ncbi:hypothetical protein RLO149_c033070 [Roseobacter litoralis Och 149]|uniref:Uncharacterized protein n=1 Tax=Roseobacter litoralis (strain ATCC 49566 / DSM 6996 / JCM 21268 / NBRC 15278 / OCh 149) TaxID=391595 RepID=F7ZL45_ROSLO|nr:hypothetical protein RLO149_c033070 [Roseobacter litoralis Och 149]
MRLSPLFVSTHAVQRKVPDLRPAFRRSRGEGVRRAQGDRFCNNDERPLLGSYKVIPEDSPRYAPGRYPSGVSFICIPFRKRQHISNTYVPTNRGNACTCKRNKATSCENNILSMSKSVSGPFLACKRKSENFAHSIVLRAIAN